MPNVELQRHAAGHPQDDQPPSVLQAPDQKGDDRYLGGAHLFSTRKRGRPCNGPCLIGPTRYSLPAPTPTSSTKNDRILIKDRHANAKEAQDPKEAEDGDAEEE
jgi:hypothetical protein